MLRNWRSDFPEYAQKRIVAKIEELLPYIDQYEVVWTKLKHFNTKFPEDMRKSILQMAIEGKLVEQRPEEGTGEELYQQIQKEKAELIKEGKNKALRSKVIIAGEVPFEIPCSWRWVRLIDIIESKPSNGYSPKGVNYITPVKKLTLTATTSGAFIDTAYKYVDIQIEDDSKYWLKKNDILIQRSNSREYVGTSCVYTGEDNEYIYPDLMMRIRALPNVDVFYLDYVLKSPLTRSYYMAVATGSSESMPKINQETVANTLIPLPPFAEQKRIVVKLDELLPRCDCLE